MKNKQCLRIRPFLSSLPTSPLSPPLTSPPSPPPSLLSPPLLSPHLSPLPTSPLSPPLTSPPHLNPGNGLNVAVEDVIGPHTEVCITNLPMPLPNTDNLKLYIKLTEVEEATSQPKPDSYVELPSSYGSLKFLTDTKVCYTYTLHEKDLKGIKSKYARIQVALKIGDVMGPYVPSLWDATELGKQPLCSDSPKGGWGCSPPLSWPNFDVVIGMRCGCFFNPSPLFTLSSGRNTDFVYM